MSSVYWSGWRVLPDDLSVTGMYAADLPNGKTRVSAVQRQEQPAGPFDINRGEDFCVDNRVTIQKTGVAEKELDRVFAAEKQAALDRLLRSLEA